MAGTIRAPSDLITRCPIGTSNGISAQDIQDLIESSAPNVRRGSSSISNTATLSGGDNDLILLTGTNTYTLTLPAASTQTNKQITFKKTGASGTITIDGSGSETVDGAANTTLSSQWQKVTLWCNGSEWFIIG